MDAVNERVAAAAAARPNSQAARIRIAPPHARTNGDSATWLMGECSHGVNWGGAAARPNFWVHGADADAVDGYTVNE